MNASRDAKDGQGEDAAVTLASRIVEEFVPGVDVISPRDENIRDVGAEIHRVPRLGRPDRSRTPLQQCPLRSSLLNNTP